MQLFSVIPRLSVVAQKLWRRLLLNFCGSAYFVVSYHAEGESRILSNFRGASLHLHLGTKCFCIFTRSKAWNVSPAQKLGSWVRIPFKEWMFVCITFVLCKFQPWDWLISRPRSPTDCLRLRNWSETKSFRDALCSRGSNRNKDKYIYR
jgi:hypothetical protein